MIKKKISYDLSENPKTEYSNTFIINSLIENGFWLFDEDELNKNLERWKIRFLAESNSKESVVQLKGLGEEENNLEPKAKKGQKVRIIIQIFD